MKTIELEIKLMRYFNITQNVIVPNVFKGIGISYEADLVVLSKNGYATEIEIKTSRKDLLKDKNKKEYHNSNLFKYLFFAVPESLKIVALKEIPKNAGLFLVRKKMEIKVNKVIYRQEIMLVKPAIKNVNCVKWDNSQRENLMRLGTMRILGLKEKILKKEG